MSKTLRLGNKLRTIDMHEGVIPIHTVYIVTIDGADMKVFSSKEVTEETIRLTWSRSAYVPEIVWNPSQTIGVIKHKGEQCGLVNRLIVHHVPDHL